MKIKTETKNPTQPSNGTHDGEAIKEQPIKHTSSQKRRQGKNITVKVTPKNAKGTGHTVTSDPTEKVDTLPIAKNITISGELKIGKTLTASYEYEDAEKDQESGTTIQWYADGEAIEGATNKT